MGWRGWDYQLTIGWEEVIPGVEYLGESPSLKYSYVQPSTTNSSIFGEFLEQSGILGGEIEGPSNEVLFQEFRPPSLGDLVEHIAGFGVQRPDGENVGDARVVTAMRALQRIESDMPIITNWLNPDALAHVRVPAQTSPGIRWKKLGYATKKDALLPALLDARQKLQTMCDSGRPYRVPPAGVAGRGKRVSAMGAAGGKEGRLIIMPDLTHHLLGTIGAGPYARELRKLDKSDGGVMLGMGPFSDNYAQIAEWCAGAKGFAFLDFKTFDASIGPKLLGLSMAHVSKKFAKEAGSSAYWKAQFENLVRTEIALPDGRVYKKARGVASGDPWTSIADSYANWIALRTACDQLGVEAKIWTFGDDSIVAIFDGPVPAISDWSSVLYGMWGLTVSPTKSYVCDTLVGLDDDPLPKSAGSFLSMYFLLTPMGVRPTRPLQDLYELMLVPERHRDSLAWEVARTSAAYLVFYYNEKARTVLEAYWRWLHHHHEIPTIRPDDALLPVLREMDIPWDKFSPVWLARLPTPAEVELLYKYGHTKFFQPIQFGTVYRDLSAVGFADNSIVPLR